MTKKDEYANKIKRQREELEKSYDIVKSQFVLVNIASTKKERFRILSLVSQSLKEQNNLFKKIRQGFLEGKKYDPTLVHYRSIKVLEELEKAILSGAENISFVPNHDDVELDSASEEEEIEKKEPETDNKEQGDPLADKLVRLMSAAGTEKNGESAWWRASQVRHGLLKIYPALDEWTTHAILRALCNEDIVKEVNIITDVGHETGFVLADDYEDYYEKPEFSVKESILRILRSAVDDEGYYVGWTYNQLIAAVRSESSKVSDEVVEKSIVSLESEGMVVTWETKKNRYVAIDHETMERYWSRLKKIGHEPRNATPPTPTSSQDDENDDVPTTWDGVKAKLRLDKSFFSTDLTGRLLREFRSQPTRLWRDYDIEGLFKGDKETQEFKKDEDGKTSQLFEAIEKLIAAGLIEYIKRDSRPSLHEDRWGLTELGRVGTE